MNFLHTNFYIALFIFGVIGTTPITRLLSTMDKKPFFRGETTYFGKSGGRMTHINVLTLGLTDLALFGDCVKILDIDDFPGVHRQLWKCGDLSILNILPRQLEPILKETSEKTEEIKQMIMTGKLGWGDNVKEASFFGWYFGNHWWYWNTNRFELNQPQVVFKYIDSSLNFPTVSDIPVFMFTSTGLDAASRFLRDQFISNHLERTKNYAYKMGYEAGVRNLDSEIREAYERGKKSNYCDLLVNNRSLDRPYNYTFYNLTTCIAALRQCREL